MYLENNLMLNSEKGESQRKEIILKWLKGNKTW